MSKSKSDSNAIIAIGMIMICILAIVLLIAGCDAIGMSDDLDIYATTESEQSVYTSFKKPVTAPSEIKYLVPNALTEVNSEVSPKFDPPREIVGPEHMVYYPAYTGLRSQSVEAKLNAGIESLIFDLGRQMEPKTIAPFRGIRTKFDETSILTSSYISLYTSFNANNILSVRGYAYCNYKVSDADYDGPTWMSLSSGLTIDLNTGEMVPLEALFIDGYDYESVINDVILEQIEQNNLTDELYLAYSYSPARLTKPFDGIAHDQAYCLDNFNLTIIIEPDDSRFDVAFEQITFSIGLENFGDNLAIGTRYYEPESNLFVDETEKRMLPVWQSNGRGQSENTEGVFEGGKWYLSSYDQDERLDDLYEAFVLESKEALNALKMDGKDNNATVTLSKISVGRFVIITKNLWLTKGRDYESSTEYQVYDTSGKKLALSDLFVDGFDYDSIIETQVRERIAQSGNFTEAEIENAMEQKIFTLDQSNLTIQIPFPDLRTGSDFLQVYIPFEAFGVRNMTIFD
jgi:hypothetical protein